MVQLDCHNLQYSYYFSLVLMVGFQGGNFSHVIHLRCPKIWSYQHPTSCLKLQSWAERQNMSQAPAESHEFARTCSITLAPSTRASPCCHKSWLCRFCWGGRLMGEGQFCWVLFRISLSFTNGWYTYSEDILPSLICTICFITDWPCACL